MPVFFHTRRLAESFSHSSRRLVHMIHSSAPETMGSLEATRAEYDIIIAGGGTAACIVAARLAEADPSLSILVIEQGPNNLNDPAITTPALFWAHLRSESKYTTFYKGHKEESLNGRETVVPMGRVLGGGSSINFMMYTRGMSPFCPVGYSPM